ncbi:uncharacterized protein J8A68_005157 [[Candida] subhashii]|uniref:Hamartin n=1 Tax=[Candida] subhashii TaxID=561895 RepID=A0A8J5QH89_9ASCO|nr:uncharacterized protein J8A68_005157 [[Candida] subhashii]KAG7661365.1 hypothetical protein J8A68_005157 [[Candida] subhashii]
MVSSKSLLKELHSLCNSLDDNNDNDKQQPIQYDSLNRTIKEYLEQHNTLNSIRQSSTNISDELSRIHNKYFITTNKECLFLDILTQLLPVFNLHDVQSWLQSYVLKPAIDSGYDLVFVDKARNFIHQVCLPNVDHNDDNLKRLRYEIAESIIEDIYNIYIDDELKYDRLQLDVSPEEMNTQSYYERLRFIKTNCQSILQEYGINSTKSYFNLLNKYLVNPKTRLESLILLSSLVSTQPTNLIQITETDLFTNLLRCILFDFNEIIVHTSITILSMLLPQICNRITKYLPDLLMIYLRVHDWGDFSKLIPDRFDKLRNFLTQSTNSNTSNSNISASHNWEIANFDDDPVLKDLSFDYPYFYTLLYGLFVFNFRKFSQDPFEYFKTHKLNLIDFSYIQQLESTMLEKSGQSLDSTVQKKTISLLESFLVHPKLLKYDIFDLDQELMNPTSWIEHEEADENCDGPLKSEEIAIACLCLNPDIMINLGDNWGIQSKLLERLHGTLSPEANSTMISRTSSLAGPLYNQAVSSGLLSKTVLNFYRKMSIIPTDLEISHNNIKDQNEDEGNDVRFKEVKFEVAEEDEKEDGTTTEDISTKEHTQASISPGGDGGYLSKKANNDSGFFQDLLATHEKLHGPTSQMAPLSKSGSSSGFDDRRKSSSSNSIINDKLKHELRLSRPISSPTTNIETSTVTSIGSPDTLTLSTSRNNEKIIIPSGNGSAIDYYQRELLLFKNELEFSSYLKHLNKFQYVKLRLRLNKLKQDVSSRNTTTQDHEIGYTSLEEAYGTMNGVLEGVREELAVMKVEHQGQIDLLNKRLEQVLAEKQELMRKYEEDVGERKGMSEKYRRLIEVVVPEKNCEIENLRVRIRYLEDNIKELNQKLVSTDMNSGKMTKEVSTSNLTDQDEVIFNLKTEMLAMKEKYHKVSQELQKSNHLYEAMIKKYENKLASSKLHLNENLDSFTYQYDKKIQNLSTTILKYENLLEEKNAKILQLSSSKPISIPNPINNTPKLSYRMDDAFDHITNRSHSNSSESTSPPSGHPHGMFPPAPIVNYQHYQPQVFRSSGSSGGVPIINPQSLAATAATANANANANANAVPIMRGRGGYQKRSKKHM